MDHWELLVTRKESRKSSSLASSEGYPQTSSLQNCDGMNFVVLSPLLQLVDSSLGNAHNP